MQVTFARELREGLFLKRVNRFMGRVEIDGGEVLAHVPSSGRMQELLYPGAKVFLLPQDGARRKTFFDLVLTVKNGVLVSVDSRLPNLLVYRSLQRGILAPFGSGWRVKREVNYGASRMDFRLQRGADTCFMEVKSVTLVLGGRAYFPDAPTIRGTRHLMELVAARQDGYRAAALFIVQRGDAHIFSPNSKTDGDFALALARAAEAGVEVYAYDCRVTLEGVTLHGGIPVEIPSVGCISGN